MVQARTAVIPHYRFVQVLFLGGIPLQHENKNARTVTGILSAGGFNLHPPDVYTDIESGIHDLEGAGEMMAENRLIFDMNLSKRHQNQRRDPHIDENVMRNLPHPRFARDIIFKHNQVKYTPCLTTRRLARCAKAGLSRRIIEILAMRSTPADNIAAILNANLASHERLQPRDIEAYTDYYWDGADLFRDAFDYLNLNPLNANYSCHREALMMPGDELLASLGVVDAETMLSFNKMIFGQVVCHLLESLRNGRRLRKDMVRLYIKLDKIMAKVLSTTDRRAEHIKRMDKLFASIDFTGQKRMTLSEVMALNEGIEPERAGTRVEMDFDELNEEII